MTTEAPEKMSLSGLTSSIALGALLVGTLDGLDAVIVGSVRGVGAARVFQGIASGLVGREAFELGAATALLGVALHYFIATVAVAVFVLVGRAQPRLLRRPGVWIWGAVYGVGFWLVMNFAVIPLTFGRLPRFSTAMVANGLFAHVFLVGLPAAWAARRGAPIAPAVGS
jgi:hypothetical protein